jgi:hypothetical protein
LLLAVAELVGSSAVDKYLEEQAVLPPVLWPTAVLAVAMVLRAVREAQLVLEQDLPAALVAVVLVAAHAVVVVEQADIPLLAALAANPVLQVQHQPVAEVVVVVGQPAAVELDCLVWDQTVPEVRVE